LRSSIFTVELAQVNYDFVKRFCDLQLAEGERIEYKRELPSKLNLEKTVCAMGNTWGGVILIGVEANKTTNTPMNIPGIKLMKGLEEKVVNMCLSNISPPLVPEVKVVEFSSQTRAEDRAIIFIRVPSSYRSPHQIIRTNQTLVRTHNRNTPADLKTIERLIKRRDEISEMALGHSTRCNYRFLQTECERFQSIVVYPIFVLEPIIFFDKETDDWLSKAIQNVMSWHQRKPSPNQLELVGLTSDGKISRFCSIRNNGHITFQKPVVKQKSSIQIYPSMVFLIKVLQFAHSLYSHFGFYGEISIGLTICNAKNLRMGFPEKRRLLDKYVCERTEIYIERTLAFDELENLRSILEDVFQELCRWFGLVLEENIISEIVAEILQLAR
jgi:hypothetical protein